MKLNSLKLIQFKNYESLDVSFSQGINCVVGENGVGKTNLLDAIHYLSMTRSALNSVDQQNIQYGAPFFAILGSVIRSGVEHQINCYFEPGKKKVFKVDGAELEKLSDHIGEIPSVMVTPDDSEIIREGSEIRRRFFDSVIAQDDHEYLEMLVLMQRILKQRNSFLKQHDGRRQINKVLMETYDETLIPLFRRICVKRTRFIERFSPFFALNYRMIFEGNEEPSISYKSRVLNEDFENAYRASLEKDVMLQRTTIGAHKDDFVFTLNDRAIKKFASQGQQKSFLIALKLAEYDYLKASKGFNPLLLLDDIFDKLDDNRIRHLVNLLSDGERFSQIFLTDARVERSQSFFKNRENIGIYEIQGGNFLTIRS